jgi:hypothetical protein
MMKNNIMKSKFKLWHDFSTDGKAGRLTVPLLFLVYEEDGSNSIFYMFFCCGYHGSQVAL